MSAEFQPGSFAAWTAAGDDLTAEPPPADERYSSGGELGRGGMGVVHAATDAWLQREVAVKRPHASLSEALRSRLMREARITARLSHPGIVPIYDVGSDEQGPFYTMPVLVGRTLEARIEARTDSLPALIRVLSSTARALAFAHTRGVVHRDIKPSNVLLGGFGEVWVTDWGVAFDPEEPDTAIVGTLGFQSPEQLTGQTTGPPADVWSLGATLGAILDAFPDSPPELAAVQRRACADNPEARYPEAGAFADELESWSAGNRVAAHAYSARQLVRLLVNRWRAPLAVGAASAVALTVGGIVAFENQRLERDKAIAAEHQSELARQSANASLSVSLVQQAQLLLSRGVRPESEVLAARSLELVENQAARGVLMAWGESARTPITHTYASPCESPFLVLGGRQVCTGDTLRVFEPDGTLIWQAPSPRPEIETEEWVGDYRDARLYPDGSLLLLRQPHIVELWYQRTRQIVVTHENSAVKLTDGPEPGFTNLGQVALLNVATNETTYSAKLCDFVESAWIQADRVLAACKFGMVYDGPVDAMGPGIEYSGSASKLAMVDDIPIMGTFQGDLAALIDGRWRTLPSGIGAPLQMAVLNTGNVVVVGERSQARIWSPSNQTLSGTLPGRANQVIAIGNSVAVQATDLRVYDATEQGPPAVLQQRVGSGGLAFLSASPSGARLPAGSGDGDVTSWDASGRATTLAPAEGTIARGGVLTDENTAVYLHPGHGIVSHDLTTNVRTSAHPHMFLAKHFVVTDDGYHWFPYGPRIRSHKNPLGQGLPASPTSMTSQTPKWLTDKAGGVFQESAGLFVERFTLDTPASHIARVSKTLYFSEHKHVVARTASGEKLWQWTGKAGISAMDANESWIAVGDRRGRVTILRNNGDEVASIAVHKRLISDVILRGDVLFTGSWDGTVRRWNLGAANRAPEVMADEIRAAWGIDVDEALANVDPG